MLFLYQTDIMSIILRYSNDVYENWCMSEKCDLKCLIACWGWDFNYAKYVWENDMLIGLLFYKESMC
jgi:hypothetical protein